MTKLEEILTKTISKLLSEGAINGEWEGYAMESLSEATSLMWQPIDTAPNDGTHIWTFNGEQGVMRWIEGEGYALWVWCEALMCDADPMPDQPTHWMPLPAAPKS